MSNDIKSLADFKRFLSANINTGLKLSSKIVNNGSGEIVRENPPATIAHVQTNAFAVDRSGALSWMELGKAKDWQFSGNTAKHSTMGNNPKFVHILFEIHQ